MPASLPRGAEHRRLHRLHSLAGLAIALVLLLVVFTAPVVAGEPDALPPILDPEFEVDYIPPTNHQLPPPPPPPAPPPPIAVDDEAETLDSVRDLFDINETFVPTPGPTAPPAPPPPPGPPPPPPKPTAPPTATPDDDIVWEFVQEAPQLIGGLDGLQARVEYPELARRAEIEGTVFLQFVVNERGEVVEPVVLRSPSDLLSQAALEAIQASRFTPGHQRGRPVKVRYSLPVRFVLR